MPESRKQSSLPTTFANNLAKMGGHIGDENVLYLDPADSVDIDQRETVMICQVCKEGLNRYDAADGEMWLHARTWQNYNHDAVPIAVPRETERSQLCDFCARERTMHWAFRGERMRHASGNTEHDYGKVWSACDLCSPYLLDNDLEGLADACVEISRVAREAGPQVRPVIRNEMLRMWGTFMPTVTQTQYVGPPVVPARLDPRMMPKLQRGLAKFWAHDNVKSMMMRNSGKAGFSFPAIHCGIDDEDVFSQRFSPGTPVPESIAANHTKHLIAGIWASDLYWISETFTQLAIMAGKDLDKLIVSREELPSSFGFMVYAQPIGELQRPYGPAAIRAVSWTLVPQGIWVNLYIQGEDQDPEVNIEQMRSELGFLMCPNGGSGVRFDTEIAFRDYDEQAFIFTILSTWFLLAQPGVADISSAPVDKKAARAYQRQYNRRQPEVKLVDLRRRPQRTGDGEGHEGRKLTVRVYRRGHWKRQAYGTKHGMRKTIYVSPYIAGPEGAPLKDHTPTVKVLR